jgi:hypothetical protein
LSDVATAQTPVSFSTHTQPLATQSFTDVSNTLAVDLNNDGAPDLIIAETRNFTTVLSVSLANGDGTFKPRQEMPISSSAVPEGPLFFGDFNNDGKANIGMLVSISQESEVNFGDRDPARQWEWDVSADEIRTSERDKCQLRTNSAHHASVQVPSRALHRR